MGCAIIELKHQNNKRVGKDMEMQQTNNTRQTYKPAIGNINRIVRTNKIEHILASEPNVHKVLTLHGSTGNGKSMVATLKMMGRIYNSKREQQTFVLAGRDITTLEKRFVESNYSVLNWRPFRGKWSYKKVGIGGSRITLQTKTGEKYIYLTPFNNVSAYSRILGQTIDGFFIDEGQEADELFLQEAMVRVTRTDGSWAIITANGGDPNHFLYTGIINKSYMIDELYDDIEVKTPEMELAYLEEERREDYLTAYMQLEDNPTYTEEQLEEFYQLYPFGSFMHNSRVLGVRGFSLDSPFAAYMGEENWVSLEEVKGSWELYPSNIVFSVDSGGHVFSRNVYSEWNDGFGRWFSEYVEGDYGTHSGGHTVMVTGAFNGDYSEFLLIDVYFPNHMHQNINVDRIYDRVYNIGKEFVRVRKPYMFVDPADTNMLSMLMDKKTSGVNEVRKAVKRDNSISLDEPLVISLIQQYMMRGNFKVLDTRANRRWFYGSMIQANLESDGKLVDNRSWEADVQDALRYIFSSMYRLLVR